MTVSREANASVGESYRVWVLVSRLAIFGRINVCIMKKKKNTTVFALKIFKMEFDLYLVKVIVMEIN